MGKIEFEIDEFGLGFKTKIPNNICPIHWLSEHYNDNDLINKWPIILDKKGLEYILNNSKRDNVAFDEKVFGVIATWDATDEFPETKVQIVPLSEDNKIKGSDRSFEADEGYYAISFLKADDVLLDGTEYKHDKEIEIAKKIIQGNIPESFEDRPCFLILKTAETPTIKR